MSSALELSLDSWSQVQKFSRLLPDLSYKSVGLSWVFFLQLWHPLLGSGAYIRALVLTVMLCIIHQDRCTGYKLVVFEIDRKRNGVWER